MTAPTEPEAAEFLAVYYPFLKPVTSEIRGYFPEGFPQRFKEMVISSPAPEIIGFSIDLKGDPTDNQAQLLEQLEFFIADVESSLSSLREKQELINTYAALPDGDSSQQLYNDLARHYDKFHASHQALLAFYLSLAVEFDQAGELDQQSKLADNHEVAHRLTDLYDKVGEGQLPDNAQAHLDSAIALRQDTIDPADLRPYYQNGPPYDSKIATLRTALPPLEELATYYAALSNGEPPDRRPLGADPRELRIAFSRNNSGVLAEHGRQSEYLTRTAESFRQIHARVERGEIGAALDDIQTEQLDMLALCQEQDLWPSDAQWAELLQSSSERGDITPPTVRTSPAIFQRMLTGCADMIKASQQGGGRRGDIPDSRISHLLRPLTHAAAVAMQTAGRRDYQEVYRRSLTPHIDTSLDAAAESAFRRGGKPSRHRVGGTERHSLTAPSTTPRDSGAEWSNWRTPRRWSV